MERSMKARCEELAMIKAAAWAWHERSSVAHVDAKATEFGLQSTWQRPPPSRYKKEAMKSTDQKLDQHGNGSTWSDTDESTAASPSLFDSYDIARIAMQLNRVLEISKKQRRGGLITASPATTYRPKVGKMSLFWPRRGMELCGTTVNAVVAPLARPPSKLVRVNGHRPRRHVADV